MPPDYNELDHECFFSLEDKLGLDLTRVHHLVATLPNVRALVVREQHGYGLTPIVAALATAWPRLEKLELTVHRYFHLDVDNNQFFGVPPGTERSHADKVQLWNLLLVEIFDKYRTSLRVLTLVDKCKC